MNLDGSAWSCWRHGRNLVTNSHWVKQNPSETCVFCLDVQKDIVVTSAELPNYMPVCDWRRVDVPARDWQSVGMPDYRTTVAALVASRRKKQGLSKQAAAKLAGITPTTWRRIEDGDGVQDAKLQAALELLEISDDDISRLTSASPDETSRWLQEALPHRYPNASTSQAEIELSRQYTEVVNFTETCRRNVPELYSESIQIMLDAGRLYRQVRERIIQQTQGGEHGGDTAAIAPKPDLSEASRRTDLPVAAHEQGDIEAEQEGQQESP